MRLQADPQTLAESNAHIKTPGKTSASKLSEDLPYGQSGIRRLPGCIRCTPASSQSSSIHNSLRSIKQTAVWRLSSFSSGKFCELRDFAYGQNLCVPYAKFPPPKAKRLQLVMPLSPHRGRMIAFATAVRSGPSALRGPRDSSFAGI